MTPFYYSSVHAKFRAKINNDQRIHCDNSPVDEQSNEQYPGQDGIEHRCWNTTYSSVGVHKCMCVCVCVCVCVCQCMNYTWYWSLLASLLDDSNGDSDLLDQSDEQDQQNEKYECTKDTCNEG